MREIAAGTFVKPLQQQPCPAAVPVGEGLAGGLQGCSHSVPPGTFGRTRNPRPLVARNHFWSRVRDRYGGAALSERSAGRLFRLVASPLSSAGSEVFINVTADGERDPFLPNFVGLPPSAHEEQRTEQRPAARLAASAAGSSPLS